MNKCDCCGDNLEKDTIKAPDFNADNNLVKIMSYGEQPFNLLINSSKNKDSYELMLNVMLYFISLGIPRCHMFSNNSIFTNLKGHFLDCQTYFSLGFSERVRKDLKVILDKQSIIDECDNRCVLVIDNNWINELSDSIIINELFKQSKSYNIYIVYIINDRTVVLPDNVKELIDITITESSVFSISTKN